MKYSELANEKNKFTLNLLERFIQMIKKSNQNVLVDCIVLPFIYFANNALFESNGR